MHSKLIWILPVDHESVLLFNCFNCYRVSPKHFVIMTLPCSSILDVSFCLHEMKSGIWETLVSQAAAILGIGDMAVPAPTHLVTSLQNKARTRVCGKCYGKRGGELSKSPKGRWQNSIGSQEIRGHRQLTASWSSVYFLRTYAFLQWQQFQPNTTVFSETC